MAELSDEQIRAFLDRTPAAFAEFLRREGRRDPQWLAKFIRQQQRIEGGPVRMIEEASRAGS